MSNSHPPAPSGPPAFDAKAHLAAMAPAVGLSPSPEWHQAITMHLTIAANIARGVNGLSLPDHCEPAPVYEADR